MSTWDIDSTHSSVGFTVRHLVIAKVHGRFGKFTGSVVFNEADTAPEKVSANVVVDSIDTREEQRDGHLKSPDFFDAAKFPSITFQSTSIEKSGAGYKLHGDLTIRDVSKSVILDVEDLGRVKDPWGNDRAAFSATGQINRKDFGLAWNMVLEAGGVAVGDRVDLSFEIQAVRKKS